MGYTWFRAESLAVDHPKVMELASLLDVPLALADGYVFRLWSWVHRYAPTGAFSARVVSQLEQYMGREGVISVMREVGLVDAKTDEFCVHDWEEMQGSLVEKSKRDANLKRKMRRQNGARRARAGRAPGAETARLQDLQDRQDQQDTTNERKEPTSLMPGPDDLMALWNAEAASALPRATEMTDKRRTAAKARLAERALPVWRQVIQRIGVSSFCLGSNDRQWVATFDWLLQPDTAVKVLEGKYDDRARAGPKLVPRVDESTKVYPEGNFL